MNNQEGADIEELAVIVELSPMEHILALRRGIQVRVAARFARQLGFSLDQLCEVLSVDASAGKSRGRLMPFASERIVSLYRLVILADAIVERSGDQRGFSATRWLSDWLRRPLAALDGRRPEELLDTDAGIQLLARLIAQMESGAYG